YTLALLRHERGALSGVWPAQALGAVTSMGVPVAQAVAYLGMPAFLQDMTQTYLVRNNEVGNSADGMRSIDQLTAFYASHHVVFWQQFASSDPLRDPLYFLQAFFRSALQAATPLLSAVVLVLLVASLVAGLTSQRVGPWWRRTEQLRPVRVTALSLERHERAVYAVLGVAVFVTGLAFTLSETTFGQTSSLPGIVWVLPSALAALLVCGTLGPLPSRASSGRLPLGRIGLTVVVLCGILILVSQQRTLYYPGHESLARLGAWIPDWLARLAVLLTVVVAAVLVLFGSRRFLGAGVIRPLVVTYLACVTVGYAVTYFLVPGYVVSDYLDRMTPLVVYSRDTAIVVVLDLLVTGVVTAVRALRGQPWTASGSTLLAGAALSLAGLCALLSLDWLGMQWQYLQLMPPTNLSYFQVLEQPQFRGASFALKAYAAPVVDATGQWAYFDRELDEGQVLLTEAGYAVVRDAKTYLWFADRDSNLAYAQPDYYLCFAPQYLDTAADLLSGRPQINCSANPLVDHALVQSQEFPRDRVVAMDPTGRDQWAIVKLDWDPPPYLRPLPDAGASTYVDVSSQANPSAVNVHVRYDTEQQEGKPLVDTLIRVYWGSDADECLLTTIRSAPTIQLPGDFWGFLRVTVIPRTADQSGKEYSSDRVLVGVPPFELPDTLHGGTQYVHAATLEEAEQQAEAAGTWSPGAGTFGNQSSGPVQPSLPPARAADGACQSDTPG
ncbi:MAG: hypothetical protein JO057_03300, partial [Chloroflexi bacterium]|nr:hypothetical protein [Chloroflexota bacterium]